MQRYHHPDADRGEEMEVDNLVTPKSKPTAAASTAPPAQPMSPTPQAKSGSTSKALPPGLNFAKAVAAGMPYPLS